MRTTNALTMRLGRGRCWGVGIVVMIGGVASVARAGILSGNIPAAYTAFAWIAPSKPLAHVVGLVRYQSSSDPNQIAAQLNALPAGARALLRWESNDNRIWHNPGDQLSSPRLRDAQHGLDQRFQGPWIAYGAAAEAKFEGRFAAALAQHGGRPDLLVLDTEMGIGTWNLTQPQLAAIVADPRWIALANRFGIHSTIGLIGALDTPAARAFNLAMQVTEGAYFRDAYFAPWLGYFSHLHCSDFGDGILDAQQAMQAPDDNGVIQEMAPPMHGDTQSPCCYAWVHKIAKPPPNQGADFHKPLAVLCWLTTSARAYAQSPPPLLPWLAAKSWTDGSPTNTAGSVSIRDTPFQDELAWHICLSCGSTNILFFNPDGRPADDTAMNADLAALQNQSGDAALLRPITTRAVPFAADVLISGAFTPDGRRVYRVTIGSVDPAIRRIMVTLPAEHNATQVVIPAGACGTWLVK